MPINFPDSPTTGNVYTIGDKTWTYDGTAWNLVTSSGSDHGNLGGLADDDHTQYALADGSRGTFETSGAVSTHEAASDPHTQYLLADGTRTATELTVSGDLTVDTTTLHVDSTNNRVGIGTTTPSTALHVDGSILANDSVTIGDGGEYVAGSIYSDANWGMIFRAKQASPTQADFRWANSADTEHMRIDSSGNVGIGATSPEEELHVKSDQNGDLTQILIENLDQRTRIGSYYEAGVTQYSKIQSEHDNGADGWLSLNPEGGNVGVGVTNPSQKLHVAGNAYVTSGELFVNAGGNVKMNRAGATAASAAGGLEFQIDGTTYNRITHDSSSQLGVSGDFNIVGKLKMDGSDTQIQFTNYQDVYVGGNATTWYPVLIYRGHQIPHRTTIYKQVHNYQLWDGHMIYESLSMSNEWGGASGFFKTIYHSWTTRQFIGQISSTNQSNSQNIFWLLGGGRTYRVSMGPFQDISAPTVYLSGGTVEGTTFNPITSAATVSTGWEP